MLRHLRKGRLALAFAMLAVLCLGFATPALAEDEAFPADPANAKLTKVIIAPLNTNTKVDTYAFNFAGSGTVTKNGSKLVSGGVEQDAKTIQEGDTIPILGIEGKVVIEGEIVDDNHSIGPDASIHQRVVSKPISDILENVTFAHAGVYTYRVTEDSAITNITGAFLNSSKASYLLRVYVINDDTSITGGTKVDKVTVERELDEDGGTKSEKVDASKPISVDGKIAEDELNANTGMGGDSRGRNVNGFTFANEYAKGGAFVVKKIAAGDYANKNEEFPIVLTITDPAAADAPGCCLTYMVSGGTDQTDNIDAETGLHKQLNGVPGVADYMIEFNSSNQAIIKAALKHGGSITITGLYGALNGEPDATGSYRIKFTEGLKSGTTFSVVESDSGLYDATGYVDDKVDGSTEPTVNKTGGNYSIDSHGLVTISPSNKTLTVQGAVAGDGSTVYVLNLLRDNNASPTGILINNLPYILMVAVPVGVFAVMFVARRRRNTAA